MLLTPRQFVHLLKNSTLTPIEQQAVLDLLSSLSPEQIQQIAALLKRDHESQERLRADVEGRRDALLLQFNVEAKKIDILEHQKSFRLPVEPEVFEQPPVSKEVQLPPVDVPKELKVDSFVPPSSLL